MATAKAAKKIAKWTIAGVAASFVALLVGLYVFSGSIVGPAPSPFQLPQAANSPGSASPASPDGTWTAGSGSQAGFRVAESFLTQSGTIVGRTNAVTGSLVIAQDAISSGSFQVDLTKLTVAGKTNASFQKLLETDKYPTATVSLSNHIALTSIPSNGQSVSLKANGSLTIHGITRPVTFDFTARYDGSVVQGTGSATILASDWTISAPFGIKNDEVIEFLVVLSRS